MKPDGSFKGVKKRSLLGGYSWVIEHRYYDPSTGRYLTPDPIGQDGGLNLFAYTLNNPVNDVDVEGLGRYGITPPEAHQGSKEHVHWGTENKPRDGGAINKDGSIRHGEEPPRKVKDMINNTYGWTLRGVQPLFIFQFQADYLNYIKKGCPKDLDNYYLDENGRLRLKCEDSSL